MAKVDYKLDDIELKENLAEFGPKINKAITLTTDLAGQRGEKAMKLKAPWTDRTSAARTGLNHEVDHSGESAIGFAIHTIIFAHAVTYGIWLEIANSGNYQIIMPTIVATGQETMKALAKMFDNLGMAPELFVNLDVPSPIHKGTSQGTTVRAERQGRTAKRTAKGSTTKATNRTKRT